MVENFEAKLNEYAHLLVEVGLNLQPGQTPRVASNIECAPLARLCVAACYDCGAREVIMDWVDDFVTRQKYLRADEGVFSEMPSYLKAKFDYMLEKEVPVLNIIGDDPEMLKGVDAKRIQTWQRTSGAALKDYYNAMTANQFQWSIGAHPTCAWARKVFPGLSDGEAMDQLWDAIFAACRITGDGESARRWQEHVDTVKSRVEKLNAYAFKTLHYTNSLGTDLTIEMPENHIWGGASEESAAGVTFIANMPTEEIFSAPRYDGVNGKVYAALPLALDGNLVKDFWMEFKDGKIVDMGAAEGVEYLRASTEIDEGSAYLGEVALVPYDSPIRNTGILFYNTLFDENAACHLALGRGFTNLLRDYEKYTDEEAHAAGINDSVVHEDFMIGTEDMDITAVTEDGREVAIFRGGNWAF